MRTTFADSNPACNTEAEEPGVVMLENLRRQFVYEEWANREVLSAIGANQNQNVRPRQLMAHILSAQRLWLERLQQQAQSLAVWPEFNVGECETQAAELGRLWREYFEAFPSFHLSDTISYKNTKGEAWTDTVQDILTHVLLHWAYHRGQIAMQMRANGQTPASTDFIHAVRQGLID